ncbi:MAG: hypothetical protein JRI22_22485, partial [Deltaproteobacteria bacterium]|nr:hypothetical protein [Deltaproteobacteria bacterium]
RPNEDEDNGKISSNDGKPDPIPANEHSHAEGGKVRQDSEARGSVCEGRKTYSNTNKEPQLGDIIKKLPGENLFVVNKILDGGDILCISHAETSYVKSGKLILRGGMETAEGITFNIADVMFVGQLPGTGQSKKCEPALLPKAAVFQEERSCSGEKRNMAPQLQ